MADPRLNVANIFLYKDSVCDIVGSLENLINNKLGLVTSVVNSNFCRETTSGKHIRFTRSELLLDPFQWEANIIVKLTDPKNCDSPNDTLRLRAEEILKQELDFAQHLVSRGQILLPIHGTNTSNLARFIDAELTGKEFHDGLTFSMFD